MCWCCLGAWATELCAQRGSCRLSALRRFPPRSPFERPSCSFLLRQRLGTIAAFLFCFLAPSAQAVTFPAQPTLLPLHLGVPRLMARPNGLLWLWRPRLTVSVSRAFAVAVLAREFPTLTGTDLAALQAFFRALPRPQVSVGRRMRWYGRRWILVSVIEIKTADGTVLRLLGTREVPRYRRRHPTREDRLRGAVRRPKQRELRDVAAAEGTGPKTPRDSVDGVSTRPQRQLRLPGLGFRPAYASKALLAAGGRSGPASIPAPVHVLQAHRSAATAPTGACECSGSCGRPGCQKAWNERLGGVEAARCPRVPVEGSVFCDLCTCGLHECRQAICRTSHRWCREHGRSLATTDCVTGYANAFGSHLYDDCSRQERVVCRMGSFYERMLPYDFHELLQLLLEACPPALGRRIPPVQVVRIFLAHSIKWPPLVAHWRTLTATTNTAEGFVEAFRAVLRLASGKVYRTMHGFMSLGRNHAQTGIVIHGKARGR